MAESAEEILRATLKEKENLLKKQRLQIEQQKKLIGEQDTEIRRLNDVVDEQVAYRPLIIWRYS